MLNIQQLILQVINNKNPSSAPLYPDNSSNTNISNQQGWLIIGDSIARGSSANSDVGPNPFFTDTIYERAGGVISAINTGDVSTASNGSPWMKFGIDYYRRTSKKVCYIANGSGGSNFYPDGDNNNWYTSGTLYSAAVTAANACVSALGVTKLRGILMILGINDATAVDGGTVSLSNVQTGIDSLFTRLNSDFPGVPIHVWNIGRNTAGVSSNVTAIRAMLEVAAVTYNDVHIVCRLADNLDKYQTDNLHLSQFGNDFVAASGVLNMLNANLITNAPITRTYGAAALTAFGNFTGGNTLSTLEKDMLNDFIMFLDGVGEWSTVDSMYMFLLDSQSKALQDIKRSSKQAVNNGSTWFAGEGFKTSGVISSYIDSNFIPSVDGVGYALNNALIGFYLLENNFSTTTLCSLMGCIGSVSTHVVSVAHSNTGTISRLHNSTGGTAASMPLQAPAFYNLRRINSSANIVMTRDLVAATSASTSVALPAATVILGGRNNNSTVDLPYAGSFGMFIAGSPPPTNYIRFWGKCRELMIDFMVNN